MKITVKGYITSKQSELFLDCADRYAFNANHHKFSISDGVSKSFFPKYWAEIIVEQYVSTEIIEFETFLLNCQNLWMNKITNIVTKPSVKWFTQNAFNNKTPALATFVGLQFFEKEKEWEASALGDSFLFFIPENRDSFDDCIILSSKEKPFVFDNFPDYFSSIGTKFKGRIKHISKSPLEEGTFYLMTDALAEWFINEKDNAIGKISVWQNQKDFERFVNEERLTNKLGNDDSAILIISVEEDNKDEISYTKKSNISDIYRLIEDQEVEIKNKKTEITRKEKKKESKQETLTEETNSEIVELKTISNRNDTKTDQNSQINSENSIENENPSPLSEKTQVVKDVQRKKGKTIRTQIGEGIVKIGNMIAGTDELQEVTEVEAILTDKNSKNTKSTENKVEIDKANEKVENSQESKENGIIIKVKNLYLNNIEFKKSRLYNKKIKISDQSKKITDKF